MDFSNSKYAQAMHSVPLSPIWCGPGQLLHIFLIGRHFVFHLRNTALPFPFERKRNAHDFWMQFSLNENYIQRNSKRQTAKTMKQKIDWKYGMTCAGTWHTLMENGLLLYCLHNFWVFFFFFIWFFSLYFLCFPLSSFVNCSFICLFVVIGVGRFNLNHPWNRVHIRSFGHHFKASESKWSMSMLESAICIGDGIDRKRVFDMQSR